VHDHVGGEDGMLRELAFEHSHPGRTHLGAAHAARMVPGRFAREYGLADIRAARAPLAQRQQQIEFDADLPQ
jgi:hypothetical protein